MTRKHKSKIAAGILAAVVVLFTATAFTTPWPCPRCMTPWGGPGFSNFFTDRQEFRLQRLEMAMATMLRLSDDIGEMADRIGEMADRIVEMMELMSDDRNNATCAGVVGKTALILSPSEGQTLTNTTSFNLAGGYDDFILYASSDAGMAKPTNILVQDNDLAAALARINRYVSDDKIYVAVKAVDGAAVSDLSNTVMLYLQSN
jgi:hypothetical protein